MNFGNLLFCQPENIKRSLRNIECLEKKLANKRVAPVFNQTCDNEYLLPTLTNINPHDPAVRYEQITMKYRKELVQRQLKIKSY